jgi:hypothetical protein
VPGGSGKKRLRTSATRPQFESSPRIFVPPNTQSTYETPDAPPVDDVELFDVVDPPEPIAFKKSHGSVFCKSSAGSELFEFLGAGLELA